MKILFLVGLGVLISACATPPAFQKQSGTGFGYVIEHLLLPGHFRVSASLPEETEEKFLNGYVSRAVGEECKGQGFDFFDPGEIRGGVTEGFCYKEMKHKDLGVAFKALELEKLPPRFVVENLNGKFPTKLKVNDQVLSVEGKPAGSTNQMKALVFAAVRQGKAALKLKVLRLGKTLTLIESLAVLDSGLLTPQDLEGLRFHYR
jgi:hypothetical protein